MQPSRSVKNAEKYDTDHDHEYKVGPLPWCFIRDFLFQEGAEGAESPEELQRVINQIFRRVVGDDEQFYVYVLRVERIVDRLKEEGQ